MPSRDVNLLIDTHALLWWLDDVPLRRSAAEAIADPANQAFVSAASVWEMSIKSSAGRLTIGRPLIENVARSRFSALPITFEHAQRAGELPRHHRDPFDRMLVAQAQLEGLTIVTRDTVFEAYGVPLLRC